MSLALTNLIYRLWGVQVAQLLEMVSLKGVKITVHAVQIAVIN
jgi:hypothetical protein